jgi:single-stranded-DNA-specific exonuclease
MTNIPTLTKYDLYQLLSLRFPDSDKKLSQIPNPSLLQDSTKSAKRIAQAIQNNEKRQLS